MTGFRKAAPGAVFTIAVLSFSTLGAQESFNPASVMPAECRNGSYHCGFLPPNPDEYRSLPMVDSAFYKERGLPSSVDMSADMPPVGFQGDQGSCLGWSLAYAIRSYQEKKAFGWSYDSPIYGGQGTRVMSPSFIYNQINGGRDQGSDPIAALRLLVTRGVSTWKRMPYSLGDYRSQPGPEALAEAMQFRSRGFRAIDSAAVDSIRTELSKGRPVMLGILAYENFYKLDKSNPVYDDFRGKFFGGHAVTIVGYDDSKDTPGGRGAFKVMNSWGRAWGENGFAYISYRVFPKIVTAGFVIEQRDKASASPPSLEHLLLAPREVAATRGVFEDKVELTWTSADGAVAYEIQRSSMRFERIGFSVAPRFTDNNVERGIPYKYRIIAIYRTGRSDPELSPTAEGFARNPGIFERYVLPPVLDIVANSLGTAFRSLVTPDALPSQMTQTPAAASTNGITLSWNQTSGAEWYDIARYEPALKSFQLLAVSRETTFRDPAGRMDAVYSIRARSRLTSGAWSAPIMAGNGVTRLDASRGLYRDRITVKWDPVPGANGYIIHFYDATKQKYTGSTKTPSNQYTDESERAKSGSWTGYTVAALFEDQTGKFTGPVFGKSNPALNRMILPPPSGLAVEVTRDGAQIQWNQVAGAERYFVFRKRERDSDFAMYAEVRANQFRDKELKAGELYYYTVRASNEEGESLDSQSLAAALPGNLLALVPPQPAPPNAGQRASRVSEDSARTESSKISQNIGAGDPFARNWKGSYWDGKELSPVSVKVNMKGEIAEAVVQFAGRPAQIIKGIHPAGAQIFEIPGIKATLSRDALMLRFTDNNIAPYPIQVAMDPSP